MPRGRNAELSWFLGISRAIAGQMSYEAILQSVADQLMGIIPHDHLDVTMRTEVESHLHYETGLNTSWSAAGALHKTADSPIRALIWGELPFLLTPNAFEDARFNFDGADNTAIFASELHSRIVVPLRVQGEVIGTLAISSRQIGQYATEDVDVVMDAADILSPYLFALKRNADAQTSALLESQAKASEELMRVGALRLTEGMERERQRLGMDLHDQTLADLTRLSRRISSIRRQPVVSPCELETVESDLASCITELASLVEDVKPGLLQLFGLKEAIDAHFQRCFCYAQPSVEVFLSDHTAGASEQLPEDIKISVYRIIQEAMNNVAKHSGASRVDVILDIQRDILLVRIIDNGVGIGGPKRASVSGLDHMRTRAALISAELRISSGANGSGTKVELKLPLSTASQAT